MFYKLLHDQERITQQNTETKTVWANKSTQVETEAEVQIAGMKDLDEELYRFAIGELGPLLNEFRAHGFNRLVPVVNLELLNQLGQELSRNKTSRVESRFGRPFTPGWLNSQFGKIENFHACVSTGHEKWVRHVLVFNKDGSLGSTENAQHLVRNVDDTLKRLTHVVSTLSSIMDYDRTEAAPAAVTFTAVKTLSQTTKKGEKTVNDYAKRQWYENPSELPMGKSFFLDVSQYLGELSEQLPANLILKQHKAPITIKSTTHYAIKRINKAAGTLKDAWDKPGKYPSTDRRPMSMADGIISPEMADESRAIPPGKLSGALAGVSKWTDKQKAKARFLLAKAENYLYLLDNLPHDPESLLPDPGNKSLTSVEASLIRSLLWQWQEPARKIVFASTVLSEKTKELKKIKHTKPVSGHWDEQMRDEMQAEMYRLLDADINGARVVLERMGNIKVTLKHQMAAFTERRKIQPDKFDEFDDSSLTALMSDTAAELSMSIDYLKKALSCAGEACGRDFSMAGELSAKAMIKAATVKEKIFGASVRLTGRGLDEYSRGARIARYLASVLNEKSRGKPLPANPDKVLSLLKKEGLLNGVLSEGDPEGYLMATRLAGESENASYGELIPLMTPEQYVALEKNIVEHIVKWGQRNISAGVSRLIFELSFGAAEFSMKPIKMAWKVVKASIKIPYKIHLVNKHTMPGQDKPYMAIYDMLDKKLTQLGFGLLMSPVPGVIATAAGAAAAISTFAYNKGIQSGEETVTAIYGRVVNGEKSQQIKTTSASGVVLDAGLYLISGGAGLGVKRAITAQGYRPDGLPDYRAGTPEIYNAEHDAGLERISDYDWLGQDSEYELNHLGREPKTVFEVTDDAMRTQGETKERYKYRGKRAAGIRSAHNYTWSDVRDGEQEMERSQLQAITMLRLLRQARGAGVLPEKLLQERLSKAESRIGLLKSALESWQSVEANRLANQGVPDNPNSHMITFAAAQINAHKKNIEEQEVIIYDTKELHEILKNRQPRRYDFKNKAYSELISEHEKNTAYAYSMKNILRQIEEDKRLPESIRIKAGLALEGEKVIVPVDIFRRTLNNTFFLPNEPGSKYGVLICLDSKNPYTYIRHAKDLPKFIKDNMPHNSNTRESYSQSMSPLHAGRFASEDDVKDMTAMQVLGKMQPIQNGSFSAEIGGSWYDKYFNRSTPQPMDVTSLAEQLRRNAEEDYKIQGKLLSNEKLFERAKKDVNIFDPFEQTAVIDYQGPDLGNVSKLGRGLVRSGQKIISDWKGHTVRELVSSLKRADEIGELIDVASQVAMSFIPGGQYVALAQTIASVIDKIQRNKEQDPLECAGLLVQILTIGKVDAKIGRLNPELGRGTKISILIGGRVADLVGAGKSIAVAVKTGEPVAIFQALWNTGMGVKDAYHATKSIVSEVGRIKQIEEVASIKELESLENKKVISSGVERMFTVGGKDLRGRINNGGLEIYENGTWKKSDEFHLMMWRLQNECGRSEPLIPEGKKQGETSLLFDLVPQSGAKVRSDMTFPLHNNKEQDHGLPPQNSDRFHLPLGPESFIKIGPNNTVIIRAHGAWGNTGHFKAEQVSGLVRNFLISKNIKVEDVRLIELQSCYGASLGNFSQAQALANNLNVKVKGYTGLYTEKRSSTPGDGSIAKPDSNSVTKVISSIGNNAAYYGSEIGLKFKRRQKVTRTKPLYYPLVNKLKVTKGEKALLNTNYHENERLLSTKRPIRFNIKANENNEMAVPYGNVLEKNNVSHVISVDNTLDMAKMKNRLNEIEGILRSKNIAYISEANMKITDFFEMHEINSISQTLHVITKKMHDILKNNDGKNLAVHCAGGDGRSGIVKAAFLLREMRRRGEFDANSFNTKLSFTPSDKSGGKIKSEVYKPVKDVLSKIRLTHLHSIERLEDVELLNIFAKELSNVAPDSLN